MVFIIYKLFLFSCLLRGFIRKGCVFFVFFLICFSALTYGWQTFLYWNVLAFLVKSLLICLMYFWIWYIALGGVVIFTTLILPVHEHGMSLPLCHLWFLSSSFLQFSVCRSFASLGKFQFSSVAQSFLTLCDPMNRSTPGLPVHHQLPEFTQAHAGSY